MRTHVRRAATLALASLSSAVLTVVPLTASPAMALGPDDSWGDVYAVNRDDNGRVAVHVTDGASNYGAFALSIRTPLNSSPVWQFAMGDFEGDGVTDLYAINPSDGGRTAVHVLSGASNFQTFVAQYVTPMHETSSSVWEHRVADYNADGRSDVFVINRNDGGRTAVHVLDAASGFQTFSAHEVTAQHATTDPQWEVFAADFNGDRHADLYAINKNDNGKTSVHVLDGATRFQIFVAHESSALASTTDWVWSLGVGDREGDGSADVYAFNRSDVATSNTRTSIHVASGSTLFRQLSLQVVSAIGMTATPQWELHVGGANFAGAGQSNEDFEVPGVSEPDMSFRAPGIPVEDDELSTNDRLNPTAIWWVIRVVLAQSGKRVANQVVSRATYEAAKRAAVKMAAKELGRAEHELYGASGQRLRSLTQSNFRENVRRRIDWSKLALEPYDVHHTLPVKFEPKFAAAGFNIHNPVFGHPWCSSAHRSAASRYNEEWEKWFASRTVSDTPAFRAAIEQKRMNMMNDPSYYYTYQCQ